MSKLLRREDIDLIGIDRSRINKRIIDMKALRDLMDKINKSHSAVGISGTVAAEKMLHFAEALAKRHMEVEEQDKIKIRPELVPAFLQYKITSSQITS